MPTKPDREDLVRLYWQEGFDQAEMAKFYDTDQSIVCDWMKEQDVPAYGWKAQSEQPYYKSERVLRYLYEKRLFTMEQIGELFDVTGKGIEYWMDKHGIERRSISEAAYIRRTGEKPPEDWTPPSQQVEEPQSLETPGPDNAPPVLIADGGPNHDPDEDPEPEEDPNLEDEAVPTNWTDQEPEDEDDSDGDDDESGPGKLTDDDRQAMRLVITAWDETAYADLSVTEISQLVGVTRYWVNKAINRLVYEGKIQQERTVGVSKTYSRVSSDLSDVL